MIKQIQQNEPEIFYNLPKRNIEGGIFFLLNQEYITDPTASPLYFQ
ncbi:hypothetical protein J4405_00365 [Candidatus Woesearchaeota archaeon]|nr:hypothetical protein [Candidatus Woesearchaeota archaeon]